MAKLKKKRNKVYAGTDAAAKTPTIQRFEAVERNPVSQWWFEKKRVAKPIGIAIIVIVGIIWIIIEGIRAIS